MRRWIGFGMTTIAFSLLSMGGLGDRSVKATPRPLIPFSLAQKALQEKLKDFTYWSDLCNLQADSGKYEEALASCEQAILLRQKDPVIWADHSGVLLQMKKYPEAIASAEKSLGFNPKTSLALTYQCMAFAALGRSEEALDECSQALRVDGNWGRRSPALAWVNRGLILSQLGQFDQALIAFDRALLLEPKNPQTQAYRCDTLSKLGKQQEAVASCDQAIAGSGKGSEQSAALALANRAVANRQLNQLDTAVADYDRAISLNPNDPSLWAAQATVLEKLAQFNQALTSYDRAVQLNPKSSLAQVGRCTMLNVLAQHEKALEACDLAIQGDGLWNATGAAQAWNQRSKALTGLGKYEEALASSSRATGIKPDYTEAWSDRAVVLWYLKQYDDAIAATQVALRLNPNYAQAWLNQGTILRSQKKYAQALSAYDAGLKLDPTNSDGWADRSAILWRLKRYKEAIAAADKAIQFNPKSFQGWHNRGVALIELGRYSEALIAYNRAVELNPKSAEALTGRGIALARLKKYTDAIAALQASLALNPNQPLAQETLKTSTQAQQKLLDAKKTDKK
jgi:tetratricopeptide (TPR) repeat protein